MALVVESGVCGMTPREEQQDELQNAIEQLVEVSVDLAVYRERDATSPYGFICHENAVTAAERKLEDLMIDIFGADDA